MVSIQLQLDLVALFQLIVVATALAAVMVIGNRIRRGIHTIDLDHLIIKKNRFLSALVQYQIFIV